MIKQNILLLPLENPTDTLLDSACELKAQSLCFWKRNNNIYAFILSNHKL